MPHTVGAGTAIALVIALASLAAAAPSPSPAAATASAAPAHVGAPLREIGHVQAKTRFCQTIYDFGGLATSATLAGDADLDDDLHWLSVVDLDSTVFSKQRGLSELLKRYTTLRARSRDAIEQAKTLRAAAADAPTVEQRVGIVAYADALGGALHRQQLLAEAISRFMLYVQVHDPVSEQQRDEAMIVAAYAPMRPFEHSADPRDRVPQSLSETAKSASIDLSERRVLERADEQRAAETADNAFAPCLQ